MLRREMKENAKQRFKSQHGLSVLVIVLAMLIMSAGSGVSFGILSIFLLPVMVGEAKFFLSLKDTDNVDMNLLFDGFKGERYLRNVAQMFLKYLFIFLWTLLLIVPGIIKTFSYAMVPFILADDAIELGEESSITVSRRMMHGHKGELFVLYLSFIGWMLLSMLTLGVLWLLYVGPYFEQTRAIFYEKVKTAYQEKALPSPE